MNAHGQQQPREISLQQYVADCWLAGMTRTELKELCTQWRLGYAAVQIANMTFDNLAREFERANTENGR
jgi:hypothetical protein